MCIRDRCYAGHQRYGYADLSHRSPLGSKSDALLPCGCTELSGALTVHLFLKLFLSLPPPRPVGPDAHADDHSACTRPCEVDILGSKVLSAAPLRPLSIAPVTVVDLAPSTALDDARDVDLQLLQQRYASRFNRAPHVPATCLPVVSPHSSPHTHSTHASVSYTHLTLPTTPYV